MRVTWTQSWAAEQGWKGRRPCLFALILSHPLPRFPRSLCSPHFQELLLHEASLDVWTLRVGVIRLSPLEEPPGSCGQRPHCSRTCWRFPAPEWAGAAVCGTLLQGEPHIRDRAAGPTVHSQRKPLPRHHAAVVSTGAARPTRGEGLGTLPAGVQALLVSLVRKIKVQNRLAE